MSKKNKATDEAQIRALVESWAKAVRAKDMDGALSHPCQGHADV
jgi:ketosteroid isomerase-like protein